MSFTTITKSVTFAVIKEKKVHPKLTVAGEGKDFSQNGMEDNYLQVEVFNSDYIRENLKWDSEDPLNAIVFDVG